MKTLLDELAHLRSLATAGQWHRVVMADSPRLHEFAGQHALFADDAMIAGYGGPPMNPDDIDYIVALHDALPKLAEVLRALTTCQHPDPRRRHGSLSTAAEATVVTCEACGATQAGRQITRGEWSRPALVEQLLELLKASE
jgi:hypothetical protein